MKNLCYNESVRNIIFIFITFLFLFVLSVRRCFANPSLILLPMFPELQIWALLVIIIIEYIVFRFKYNKVDGLKLLSVISYANILSSIVGIILSSIVYIGLDFANTDKAVRSFDKLILSITYISIDRHFFSFYFVAILWSSIALAVAYLLGVYIESRIIIKYKIINDTDITSTTYYANLYSYLFVATIIFYDLYIKTQKLIDGSIY